MKVIRLYAENDVEIEIDKIVPNLNKVCKHHKFMKGNAIFELKEEEIEYPRSFHNLSNDIKKEIKDDFIAILFTNKQYNDNYFWYYHENLSIFSFHGWDYLTKLSYNNGVIYTIAFIIAYEFEHNYRHTNNTGCIYDFLYDKTGIDLGMRSANICQSCLSRISNREMTPSKKQQFSDLRNILNHLGSASKWNLDIVDYWDEQLNENGGNDSVNINSILSQTDFLPENDDNNFINTNKREYIHKICESYVEMINVGDDHNRKGEVFENFSKCFFNLIKGWRIIAEDRNLGDCEIDLIYDISEGPRSLKDKMGDAIYIECKYRKDKSDSRDISHFIMNVKSRNLKAGIFFSYKGITGYHPDNWSKNDAAYKRIINVCRQENIYVLPMVSDDIEIIKNGKNLVNHLNDIYNRFIMI